MIEETILYRNLHAYLNTHPDWPALEARLRVYYQYDGTEYGPKFNRGNVDDGFVWRRTWEGSSYWLNVHAAYSEARRSPRSSHTIRFQQNPITTEELQHFYEARIPGWVAYDNQRRMDNERATARMAEIRAATAARLAATREEPKYARVYD